MSVLAFECYRDQGVYDMVLPGSYRLTHRCVCVHSYLNLSSQNPTYPSVPKRVLAYRKGSHGKSAPGLETC